MPSLASCLKTNSTRKTELPSDTDVILYTLRLTQLPTAPKQSSAWCPSRLEDSIRYVYNVRCDIKHDVQNNPLKMVSNLMIWSSEECLLHFVMSRSHTAQYCNTLTSQATKGGSTCPILSSEQLFFLRKVYDTPIVTNRVWLIEWVLMRCWERIALKYVEWVHDRVLSR